MDSFYLNSFDSPSEIPRESLINLLKSDRVNDSLLDWACRQCDREIALAILMNSKTSQKHLESLFETFDNYLLERYGSYPDYYLYDRENEYKDYRNDWNILNNIEHHIHWEQKELEGNWQKNIIYKLCAFSYPDPFYSSYFNRPQLAKNPNTPENILLKLLKQNHYEVIPKLRQNPNLSDYIAEKLPDINDNPFNWDLAYINIPVEQLKRIALTSNDYKVRERIVYNPNINAEILEILADDSEREIRYRVATTYGTPLNLLEKLAKDKEEEVRYGVLDNPKLTKDIFYRLMPDIYGRCDYSLGRLLAFLDPNVSPEILEQNANSLLWNERFAIAIHPKTPQQTIQKLARDGNIYVKAIAQKRESDCNVQ